MQTARSDDAGEILFDGVDPFLDQPAVGLDLRLARTTEKAKAAALAFEMRPAAHQPAALIGQVRKLDLQPPFPGQGPLAENLQDEAGAIENLAPQACSRLRCWIGLTT